MFLDTLARRNPDLIRAAIDLHQAGEIPPNSYVLDLDTIRRNARLIKQAADKAGLYIYPMAKQVGRNPHFIRAIARAGMPKFVCVDWMGARLLARQKARIGHVGHLVQIPRNEALNIAALEPEVWTVFNLQKAREVSAAAQHLGRLQDVGRVQDLLLRVVADGDTFYPTHDGGFQLNDIVSAAREIAQLPAVRIVGVTSFPALLYDPEKAAVVVSNNLGTGPHVNNNVRTGPHITNNLHTIVEAASRLRREAGLEITQINAPGTTSAATMEILAASGATHVEPGHGYTGTTPWHGYEDLPERPAMCYVTEVTDVRGEEGYVLGGGFFIDPVIPEYAVRAFVGRSGEDALGRERASAKLGPAGGIDYYALLDRRSTKVEIGDSVVFGFRAQVFATRGQVAVIRGLSRNAPKVAGVFDTVGRRLRTSGQ